MIVLISPSKTLNYEDTLQAPEMTTPSLHSQTKKLLPYLQKLTKKEFEALMKISPKLAQLNHDRFQQFLLTPKPKRARQALLAFRGDVYNGFSLETYTKQDFMRAQKTIRILSGLYGLLKPLDAIQPYRLEMSTKLKTTWGNDLYTFWNNRITKALQKEIENTRSKYIINLASQEYAKSISFQSLPVPTVHIDFKEMNGGKLRTIGLFAKKARGEMANYIVQNRIKSPDDITSFRKDGYRFKPSGSTRTQLLFVR